MTDSGRRATRGFVRQKWGVLSAVGRAAVFVVLAVVTLTGLAAWVVGAFYREHRARRRQKT